MESRGVIASRRVLVLWLAAAEPAGAEGRRGAREDLQRIIAERGAAAFTDDLWDHINLEHIQEDDRGFR